MHLKNVLHRDLKLDNILFDKNGYITIIDFGISRRLRFEEDAQTYAGTKGYQAPEMLAEGAYNRGIDWWSLGIMIYELLIGCKPFSLGVALPGTDEWNTRV